jgi:hypothetical protein
LKRGSSNRKGHKFENKIAKKLSQWWTNGKRDDVFLRSDSSGARATQRSKKGKKTFGQYGDIQAADPIGQSLMDLCVIECKDGYAHDSVADIIDKLPKHKPNYEQFIQQAIKSAEDADKPYWLLIARRRGRQIMAYFWIDLLNEIPSEADISNYLSIQRQGRREIIGTPLDDFLRVVNRSDIKNALANL